MRPGRVMLPAARSTRRAAPLPERGDGAPPLRKRLSSVPAVNPAIARTEGPERPSERQRLQSARLAELGVRSPAELGAAPWAGSADLERTPEVAPQDLDET
ncbi:MAG: hypothetical protein JWP64_4246 [Pseudonocardia sp.]|jgi:hypothetical protein|uniref:hypothetical protein n=1 Tax=Pseudonocardia sp. TaxID=60912 RepID=UPI0026284D7B|nr:hypothetical protein [Pseudonocardia sp.]MCU1629297.1 hypothetical protein [Pseudonocardia sp.]MDT7703132.1 hypothetical protein [Pseudonocardiales bacterium]